MRLERALLASLFLLASVASAQTRSSTPAHPPGGYVTVHGAKLWYESEGQGPALVLIAGGPGSSHEYFHPYFSPLSVRYRIIYVDAFGRGKSDKAAKPSDYTFTRDVDDIEGLRVALNLGKITVFGPLIRRLRCAGVCPEVSRLHPFDHTCQYVYQFSGDRRINAINERFLQDFFPELWDQIEALKKQPPSPARDGKIETLTDSVPAPIRYDYDPAKSAEFDAKHAAFNVDVLKAIWPGSVNTLDFRKSLATLKCPILVLAGRVDRIAPPRLTRQFRTYAPQAEYVMFEKSGHDTFLEEPAKLIQVLTPFLAKQ